MDKNFDEDRFRYESVFDTSGEPADMLGQRGAMALANRLQKYWQDRGYTAARFWAEPLNERFSKVGTYEIYRVTCNLVNGLPPRYVMDNKFAACRSFPCACTHKID